MINLPKYSIENKAVTIAVTLALMIWGLSVYSSMSRREDPDMIIRKSILVTSWLGASAEKMEQLITNPLEMAIKEVSEVKKITSDSRVGLSSITIQLMDEVTEVDDVWGKIRAKIARVSPSLPEGSTPPNFNTDFGEMAVMVLALYQTPVPGQEKIHRPYSFRELDDLLKQVEDHIQEIPMVGKIEKHGLQKQVIHIEGDGATWGQLNILTENLRGLINSRNLIAPGGTIPTKDSNYTVQPSGEFLHPQQIQGVIVEVINDVPVYLKDLNVDVSLSYKEPRDPYTRYTSPSYPSSKNQTPCLVMSFSMREGYNVVDLGKHVRKKIQTLSRTILPPDIKLEIVSDTPLIVDRSINDFIENLWQAIALVLGVALVMTGLRTSIIMATSIPLALLISIGFMSIFQVDLEQCSIASLIISLGMLVDNAVVISDNSLRLYNKGRTKTQAAWEGAQQLSIPVLSSTLTTIAAFLPMLMIPGSMGEYIRSLPIVVSITLVVSYLVAMSVTPLMCSLMLKKTTESKRALDTSRFTQEASGFYGKLLKWALRHQVIVLFTAFSFFVASLFLVGVVGSAFFPKGLRDQFIVAINLPAGASLSQTDRTVQEVEKALLSCSKGMFEGKSEERFRSSISYIGRSGPRFYNNLAIVPARDNYAQIMVNTHSKWFTSSYIQDLQKEVDKIVGARIVIRTLDFGPPVATPIEIRISGEDISILQGLADKVEKELSQIPGSMEVHNSWGKMSYQLAVDVDEDTANLAGVNNMHIARALYGYYSGYYVTTYREGRHKIQVMLRVREDQRKSLDFLPNVYVEGNNGKIPLDVVAKVTPYWQMSLIQRRNLIRTIEVRSFVKPGYLSNRVIAGAMPMVRKNVPVPLGYKIEIGGELEETIKSQRSISQALLVSLVLIILTLVIQFNSFLKPLIILLTVPFALIGALLGLWIGGSPLGFMPFLGIVSLCGIVVNNAIMLIEFMSLGTQENALHNSIINACQVRVRPIFLTTLTTVGGFIPLALYGGPLWEGLAYVMIFGLLVSTVLTLIIVPTVFALFMERLCMKSSS